MNKQRKLFGGGRIRRTFCPSGESKVDRKQQIQHKASPDAHKGQQKCGNVEKRPKAVLFVDRLNQEHIDTLAQESALVRSIAPEHVKNDGDDNERAVIQQRGSMLIKHQTVFRYI